MNRVLDISEKQVLRGYILNICNEAEPTGAGTEVIHGTLEKYGFSQFDKNDIIMACKYLEDKGLVKTIEVKSSVLKMSRSISQITAKGIDVLEGTEAAEGIELL